MLLDSDILIDLLRKRPEAMEKIRELEKRGDVLSTTAISVFEIIQGIRDAVPTEKEQVALQLFSKLVVFPLTMESAAQAGKIQRKLFKEGFPVEAEDCMIAEIAKIRDEKILTRNTRHFSKIPEIQVETY
jgi:predicted nucleic acid-binding protein